MNQTQQIPPFTLYGLQGCNQCSQAELFLRSRGLPFMFVVCNDDPIAQAGAAVVTKSWMDANHKNVPAFPILISRVTKEWKVGFEKAEYERIANACYDVVHASSASVFGVGQPDIEATSAVSEATSATPATV
jgi:hypothetical protein